jgi:hypothetical protein
VNRISVVLLAALTSTLVSACGSTTTAAVTAGGQTNSGTAAQETLPPGDIPDTQTFVPVSAPGGYTVKVPEGWARSSVGADVIFTSQFNSVRLGSTSAASAPTEDSARHVEVPKITSSGGHVTMVTVSTVTRPAGSAILISYEADSAPDPVTGKTGRLSVERYEFWKGGTEAIITLSAPVGSDNVDPWKTITNSVQWS